MSARVRLADRAHALILAAGRGSRLRPFTDETPKPLLEVAGRPLIAYGLGLLRAHGFEEVVINVHHLGEKIVAALGDGERFGLRITYSVERELLDTGGGIRRAATLLPGGFPPRKPLVVLNADIISEIPLDRVLDAHETRGAAVTFVLRDDPEAQRYGVFGIDEAGTIRRFLGRGAPPEGLRERMFASVQVLDPAVVAAMPETSFSSMHDFYPRLFDEGARFTAVLYEGPWHVVDTETDRVAAEAALRERGLPSFLR